MEAERETAAERRPLWTTEPTERRSTPDPVRTAAVRAFILASLAVVLATVAVLWALAGTWFAFPAMLATVLSVVVATWSAVDVRVTRQVWNQRHGVVAAPSSTARALTRERGSERQETRGEGRIHSPQRFLPGV